MKTYIGPIEGGANFFAQSPFIVIGWPCHQSCKGFEMEEDARRYVADACLKDEFATFSARIYAFSDGRWNKLSHPAIPSLPAWTLRGSAGAPRQAR